MSIQLRKAERKQARLRVGLFGPSGSGKTMSALKMGRGLASDWNKICVIDTENGSADLYSELGEYKVITLEPPFNPEKYIEAIHAAEQAGMEVIIVDSITHEWAGQGGILEIADQLGKDAKNAFAIWGKLTPRHNRFIDAIIQSKAHMICCGRSKQDYALNQVERNGKTVNIPEKIGLKSITREGFDYEMTVSFDLPISHLATSTKDRTGLFQDKGEFIISEETGIKLLNWANSGKPDKPTETQTTKAQQLIKELGGDLATFDFKGKHWEQLSEREAELWIKAFDKKLAQKKEDSKDFITGLEDDQKKVEADKPVSSQDEDTTIQEPKSKARELMEKGQAENNQAK